MAPTESGASARKIYSVGALLAGINGLLQDRVGRVWVQGEISNLHRAASGHCYFTLKDDRGQLRAALFRGLDRGGGAGAGDGIRTRDTKLGKLVLYQLSYARLLLQPPSCSSRLAASPSRKSGDIATIFL